MYNMQWRRFFILFFAMVSFVACQDEKAEDTTPDDHHEDHQHGDHENDEHPQGSENTHAVQIAFQAWMGEKAYRGMGMGNDPECVAGMGTPKLSLAIHDVRFYIFGVEAHESESDTWTNLSVNARDGWSKDGITLIDLSDYTYNDGGEGTTGMNNVIEGELPHGTYDNLRFTIGVPFEDNHEDVIKTGAPLNAQGMNWGWLSGHRFMRIDGEVCGENAEPRANGGTGLVFHLGSTGCEGDPGLAPEAACANPNHAIIALDWTVGQNILLDLDALFADSDMVNTGGPDLCMSGATDADCAPFFKALGIPFGDDENSSQTVFSATDIQIEKMQH